MRIATLFLTYYGFVAYSILNPFIGVLFFVHITILRPEQLTWGSPAFGRLHLIAACAVLVGYLFRPRPSQAVIASNFQSGNIFIFGLWVVWLFVGSLLAEYSVTDSMVKAVDVLKIFVLCFLFARVIGTVFEMNAYIGVVALTFGFLGLWGTQQGLSGNDRLDNFWPGGSNLIAAALALVGPVVLAKCFDPALPIRYRAIFLGCAATIASCMFFTVSRGGLLGLAAGCGLLLLVLKQRLRVGIAIVFLIVLILPWVPDTHMQRLTSTFTPSESLDVSASSRFVLWELAYRIWLDYPVKGVGLENFSDVKERYSGKMGDIIKDDVMYYTIFERKRYPHGLYTGMLAETGAVGLGLFLALVGRAIISPFPRRFSTDEAYRGLYLVAQGGRAGLLGFMVSSFFSDTQYIEQLYFQIFFLGAVHNFAESLELSAHSSPADPLESSGVFDSTESTADGRSGKLVRFQ